MDCDIRPAKPQEVVPALQLALRVFSEFEAPDYKPGAVERFKADCVENEQDIEDRVSGRKLTLVALDGETIVGMTCERANGHVSMLFVDGAYHRRGIGTALLGRMVAELKRKGFARITLNASPYGMPFYLLFGFVPICEEQEKDGFIFTPMAYEPGEILDLYTRSHIPTGRVCERGRPTARGEYRLTVDVWMRNRRGQWLISKRTPNKTFPGMWECTGGYVLAGERSAAAALREVKEELGLALDPSKGKWWRTQVFDRPKDARIGDVWVFAHDCPIGDVVFQEGETCGAIWASSDEIECMIGEGRFIGRDIFPYLDDLFEAFSPRTDFAGEADVPGWLELVKANADYFPGLDMASYEATLRKNIARKTALCVKIGGKLAGVLLFSRAQGCLSFLAVDVRFRKRGVASSLILRMLTLMPEGDVTVTTYREGDEKGIAARALYQNFGFEPGELITEHGYPLQKLVLRR